MLHIYIYIYDISSLRVKDKLFSTPVPDMTNLKARITDAFVTITEDMLENTWRETDCRLYVLRATKGAHVEMYRCVVRKLLELSYILQKKKKNYVCIPGSFLVVNICNQGKNLCSPCSFQRNLHTKFKHLSHCFTSPWKPAAWNSCACCRYHAHTALSTVSSSGKRHPP